jgi:cysteinyl-tRNA synthetase
MINSIHAGTEFINSKDLLLLRKIYDNFACEILGLRDDSTQDETNDIMRNLVDMVLNLRTEAKANKDYQTSDKIRNELIKLGITIMDTKDGVEWKLGN